MTKQFSDFGVEAPKAKFTGDKIKMKNILNIKVQVLDYLIEPSKFEKGSGSCLRLQLLFNDHKRVLFTGSRSLIEQIKNIQAGTQFETIIVEKEDQYLFT